MAEAKGTRVRLPAGVHPPFEVFINGVIQEPGRDYQVRGDVLLFDRDLVPPPPETPRSLLRGLFWGRYRAEHVVDVAYQANGRGHVASGLEILADERD